MYWHSETLSNILYVKEYIQEHAQDSNTDPVVDRYLQILGITYGSHDVIIVDALSNYPQITDVIYRYLTKGESIIDYLQLYSGEQIKYITSVQPKLSDNKLIACAGSGKTRSIIGRIRFLSEHGLVNKDDIYMITFSKAASVDFRESVKRLFPDYGSFCKIQNFSTIDSLAKSFLCRVNTNKSHDVEILSVAFMNYLEKLDDNEIHVVRKIKNIRHIFVDEAQDLNHTQYRIVQLLSRKFGTVCELVGDPNQNIFQFRRSSSTYLMDHDATAFQLTNNYRSTQQIIDFCEFFKSNPGQPSVSGNATQGKLTQVISYPSTHVYQFILEYIVEYGKTKDISEIAIISPTRGTNGRPNVGLSAISHLLKANDVPFHSQYNETLAKHNMDINKNKREKHVNLLTYHGTKGLEFKVVFVMDFYIELFNIYPTEEEYNIHRYLLYVALSRASEELYICNCTDSKNSVNNRINQVPDFLYELSGCLVNKPLNFRKNDATQEISEIEKLVTELTDVELNKIHDEIKIVTDIAFQKHQSHYIDVGKDNILFEYLAFRIFHLQYALHKKGELPKFDAILHILEGEIVGVADQTDYHMLRKQTKNNGSLSQQTAKIFQKYSDKPYDNNILICTVDMAMIIKNNINDIKSAWNKYCHPESYNYDYRNILHEYFYLVIVEYSYLSSHFYYIDKKGLAKYHLLDNGMPLFETMHSYVTRCCHTTDYRFNVPVCYSDLGISGIVPIVDEMYGSNVITIGIYRKEHNITDYVKLIIWNFAHRLMNGHRDRIYCNEFRIYNMMTGYMNHVVIGYHPSAMFKLMLRLAKIGSLKLKDMDIVYDLETTGFIRKSEDKASYIYPNIIEITMIDRRSGMIILDTLVDPKCKLSERITKVTGINNRMLIGKPTTAAVREYLWCVFDHIVKCKLIAHNGDKFDHRIIMAQRIIPVRDDIQYADTLVLIPKLIDSKGNSMKAIYEHLFGGDFQGHRSRQDVEALIDIINRLDMTFN